MANPLDKNMIVPTKIKKDGIRFYSIDDEPFSIHGVYRNGDRYYRLPRERAEKISANITEIFGRSKSCLRGAKSTIRS